MTVKVPGVMRPLIWSVIWFSLAVLLIVAGTTYSVWTANHTSTSQSQQWCDVLNLLTRTPVPKPVDPKANPSREGQYQLYLDFVKLKAKFDCGAESTAAP